MIRELERVALTVDLPEYHLKAGDMGTVVDITSDDQEYTIEFFTLDGETFAVVPVQASQIRRVGSREIAHARMMET
ncbi:MAG: DUF4926 domain-containing protein [Chloroflexi bacterium]|nr:DUF4926 domain-containing protein [Chloroflexota bacterium]MDL1882244.1 DUF4926 domain-containing protein [Anaerolineae bacterium CFX8]